MLIRRNDENWDMTFGHALGNYYRDSNEAIGQSVKSRLLLILGEWFLDINEGVPWRSILGRKPIDTVAIETAMRNRILGTEGVVAITAFSLSFDPITRKATISVTVQTIYATSVTVTVP